MKNDAPETITATKAGEMIGCDSRTIRRMVKRGDLVGSQIDGGATLPYMVTLESVKKFIASQNKKRDQSSN